MAPPEVIKKAHKKKNKKQEQKKHNSKLQHAFRVCVYGLAKTFTGTDTTRGGSSTGKIIVHVQGA